MPYLSFFSEDNEGDELHLFTANASFVPRVGDIVSYSVERSCRREDFDPENWDHLQEISRKGWEVVKVQQDLRRHDLKTTEEVICVFLKPAPDA